MRTLVVVLGCLFVAITALSGVAVAGDSPAVLSFDPDETELSSGETVTVDAEILVISATEDENISSVTYTIAYDPEILSAITVEQGPWLQGGAETEVPFEADIDNDEGRLNVTQSRDPPAGGVTGDGTTATIEFEVSEDAPPANAILQYTDPDVRMVGYDWALGTRETEGTLSVNGGGEERGPVADEETDDGPGIVTPEPTETSADDEPNETESTGTEDQPGFGPLLAIVALLSAAAVARLRQMA